MVMFVVRAWCGLVKNYSVRVVDVADSRIEPHLRAIIALSELARKFKDNKVIGIAVDKAIERVMKLMFEDIAEEIFTMDNCRRGTKSVVVKGGEWSLTAGDIFIARAKFVFNDEYYVELRLYGRYCSVGAIGSIEVKIHHYVFDPETDTLVKEWIYQGFAEVDYCRVW